MSSHSLEHLSDRILLCQLTSLVNEGRRNLAAVLAHIGEVDARKLYVGAGHPSMFAYCVEELHFSEGASYKRIWAARACREFPQLHTAVAGGQLHLAAVCLLAPHLTAENVDTLVRLATHRKREEVEEILARWSKPELPEPSQPLLEITPGQVEMLASSDVDTPSTSELSPGTVQDAMRFLAAAPIEHLVNVAIRVSTRHKIRRAQELLGHSVPSGDVSQVLDRALDLLITRVEKQRFGAGTNSQRSSPAPAGGRYIPAHIRNAVWKRDGGRCTFVGAKGNRCTARRFLELDHVKPVAQGGEATVDGIRLLCRAHNQFEAERAFGAEFMKRKREQGGA